MEGLEKYNKYSRRQIHDIFSPDTNFTPGAGYWGISGIIKVPGTQRDYIFLVTYGQKQANHAFDEGIDEEGILTWQSQPQQKLTTPQIITFINHDYTTDNIHLFLRENEKSDYTYLGLLAYVDHDNQREKPVYFRWQILDWNEKEAERTVQDTKKKELTYETAEINAQKFVLTLREDDKGAYITTERKGKNTEDFNRRRDMKFIENNINNKALGDLGEDVVVEHEKRGLIQKGRSDLADKVKPTRTFIGNAARYDVLSFDEKGEKKYIEVKTTVGAADNEFFISLNEIEFSKRNGDNYFFYRLYNFDKKTLTADFIVKKGPIDAEKLTPVKYIGRIGDLI